MMRKIWWTTRSHEQSAMAMIHRPNDIHPGPCLLSSVLLHASHPVNSNPFCKVRWRWIPKMDCRDARSKCFRSWVQSRCVEGKNGNLTPNAMLEPRRCIVCCQPVVSTFEDLSAHHSLDRFSTPRPPPFPHRPPASRRQPSKNGGGLHLPYHKHIRPVKQPSTIAGTKRTLCNLTRERFFIPRAPVCFVPPFKWL